MTAPEPACTAENPCAACVAKMETWVAEGKALGWKCLSTPPASDPDQEDIDMDDELVSGGKCGGSAEEKLGAASAFGWCIVGGLFVLVIFAAGMAFAHWGLGGGSR